MFNVGDIVKYADGWCEESERQYVFVVLETGLFRNRVKIGCLNSSIKLGYIDTVEEEMIVLVNKEEMICAGQY